MTDTSHAAHGGHGDDHGHGHGHGSQFIQHHYDDAQHQFDSGKLGIWLFLAQEVLFFSALFVAYVLYRYHHPEVYGYAHQYLDVKMGAINTAVLIFSSLTAAWAVRAAQLAQRTLLIVCLAATILCALTFLGVKYVEYSHKIHEQLLPGRYFDPCVSSGGVPLMSRSNNCPGSLSSVVWDDKKADPKNISLVEGAQIGAPAEGCFAESALDLAPDQRGLQTDCVIEEVQGEIVDVPQPKVKDKDGKEVESAAKKLWKEKTRKPITNVCADPIAELLAKFQAAPHAEHGGTSKQEAPKYPCWRPAVQPAVCRPNFYYNQWCSDKFCSAPNPTPNVEFASTSPFPDKAGEKFKSIGPFTSKGRCEEAVTGNSLAIKKLRNQEIEGEFKTKIDEAKKRGAPPEDLKQLDDAKKAALDQAKSAPIGQVSECRLQQPLGILVEYGDHEHRPHTTRIRATCKTPAAPVAAAAGDAFADKTERIEVGKKQEAQQRPLTTHEQHELEAAGPPPPNTNMFFTIYFAMTGLHGIHVLFGVFVFVWLLIRAVKGHFTPDYFGPVDFAALYWHIVDLIWIFLFPLLYLIH